MKATVDLDTCTGCGLCADICPGVFAMSSGAAEVIADPVPQKDQDACLEAKDSCPVEAISVED